MCIYLFVSQFLCGNKFSSYFHNNVVFNAEAVHAYITNQKCGVDKIFKRRF